MKTFAAPAKSAPASVSNPWPKPLRACAAGTFSAWCASSLGLTPGTVRARLQDYLEEDHGGGCVTLWAGLAETGALPATAVIVAKQDFTLCGLELMLETFRLACGHQGGEINQGTVGSLALFSDRADGDSLRKGDVLLWAEGNAAGLLLAERVALNFASLLSGVSTYTRRMREALEAEAARQGVLAPALLETRKTTPGLRVYEKYATRTGGARNHRHGLDAGAMLKENHLRAVGDLREALRRLKVTAPVLTRVEVEVTNLGECEAALEGGADVVMLDNFAPGDVFAAVALRAERAPHVALEVSGNLDGRNPAELVSFGVDFLSMGALVHKAAWVDMSLQLYSRREVPQ